MEELGDDGDGVGHVGGKGDVVEALAQGFKVGILMVLDRTLGLEGRCSNLYSSSYYTAQGKTTHGRHNRRYA